MKILIFLFLALTGCTQAPEPAAPIVEIWGDSATGWRVETSREGVSFFRWSDSVSDTAAMREAANAWLNKNVNL